jgi:hypothetical protein
MKEREEESDSKALALQMFYDCYLKKIKTMYGECYYLSGLNGQGRFLNIEDTDKILKGLPLQSLEREKLISEYEKLQRHKKKWGYND